MAKPRLNQIVAVVAGKKTRTEKAYGDLNKQLQHPALFVGLHRTYAPAEEGGEQMPDESKRPHLHADKIVADARAMLTEVWDAVATQEEGNTVARGTITVDGVPVLPDVPVPTLLYLEKQLNDLRTFVGNIPVLDPVATWRKDGATGEWHTEDVVTRSTRKVEEPLVLLAPTKEHPGQAKTITKDVLAGYWTTRMVATAWPGPQRAATLKRIDALIEAVRYAREAANNTEVEQMKIATRLLDHVFGNGA